MQLTLREIRARKDERRRALEKELDRVKKLLTGMGALKIILFGSCAHRNVRSDSDLDLIAVMPSDRTGKEWMKIIYDTSDREVDCDILAFTREELERAMPLSRFLRHAVETGRVLYEKRSEG